MNKDMINIDDFVREKLGVSKEKDNPAAWLKMKDLLDNEMPEKAAPFIFRLGKPMAFLGIALLLGALCVGGYELNAIREKSKSDAKFASHNESANNQTKRSSNNSTHINDKELIEESLNDTDHEEISSNVNASKSVANSKEQKIKDLNGNINAQTSRSLATSSKRTDKRLSEQSYESKEAIKVNQSNNDSLHPKVERTTVATSASSTIKPLAKSNTHSSPAKLNSKISSLDLKSTAVEDERSNNSSLASSSDKAVMGDKVNDARLQNNKGQSNTKNTIKAPVSIEEARDESAKSTKVIDSIPLLSTVKKETVSKTIPKKITIEVDTISQNKIGIARAYSEPLGKGKADESVLKTTIDNVSTTVSSKNSSKKTKAKTAISNNEYAASKTQSAKDNSVDQKKNIGSQQKKGIANFIDKLNLPYAAANAKRDIGNAQFYAGFTAGFNYSLSNVNNFQGVQFGPTGELVFNKHWSLFGAIKYFNRSGGNKMISDSYWKETSADTPYYKNGSNWNYFLYTDSTNRHFNFSTLHSFEMPVTVRYSLHKFYVMTGINLAYYLGVNVEEVKKNAPTTTNTIVQTNSSKPILREQKPNLSISDFKSKFGLGYVFGLGYQISPAWQVDARMVNTFWDNSKGDGAKTLSKDFYKLPSLQFTVGYQFNRGKTKPTFGPTDKP